VIISKIPCFIYEKGFETMMGRSLLIAEPVGLVNKAPLLVATTHLESLNSERIRK
jgi:hypothetical protein